MLSATLQVDDYGGYAGPRERRRARLLLTHVRPRFFELAAAGSAPVVSQALQRIAELYRIEDDIRGRSAEQRRAMRQKDARGALPFDSALR
ncbi:MAG: IS66 family transposase, partial [Mesorhizobium sp.]